MSPLFSQINVDASLARRARTAIAICVAGEIFSQNSSRANNAAKALRVRIAADALDKTAPVAGIFSRYNSKPAHQSDADFLLENLNNIDPVAPDAWPSRNVHPREWNEFTRVMRGLETFLKKVFTGVKFSRAEVADVSAVLKFIEPHIHKLDADLQELFRTQPAKGPTA